MPQYNTETLVTPIGISLSVGLYFFVEQKKTTRLGLVFVALSSLGALAAAVSVIGYLVTVDSTWSKASKVIDLLWMVGFEVSIFTHHLHELLMLTSR